MPVRRGESLLYRQNHAYLALHRRLGEKSRVRYIPIRSKGLILPIPVGRNICARGKVTGHLVNKYTPEQLKEMPVDAVNAHILKDLGEDAHARQAANPIRYRGKRRAEFLETILFMCPCCKKIGGLKSQGNTLSCTCGARMTYTEYGRLGRRRPLLHRRGMGPVAGGGASENGG